MGEIVDLYAGPGGWSEALRLLGRSADEIGIEYEATACETRSAAGHRTLHADVSTIDEQDYTGLEGLIASPPCQAFSSAGKGAARDLIPELLDSIRARRWTDRADPDPRVWLIVDLGRWLERLSPEWIALEQVPAVLPLWRAYGDLLRDRGYSVWTGILNAADYGVPQTRRRAVLIASRTRTVQPPAATHDAEPVPSLFGTLEPWVTMATALGLKEPFRIGFPRLDDRGDSPDGYRERDWAAGDEPSHTVTEKARSWVRTALNPDDQRETDQPAPTVTTRADQWELNTGRDWAAGGTREDAQTIDPATSPAPTLTAKSGGQWQLRGSRQERATRRGTDEPAPTLAFGKASNDWIFERPATTVQGDPRLGAPGHRDREGGERQWPDAIRLTARDALILQSFRPDYPVAGTKTRQFEQIGNAIPPLLALHVLGAVIPSRDPQKADGGLEFPA